MQFFIEFLEFAEGGDILIDKKQFTVGCIFIFK